MSAQTYGLIFVSLISAMSVALVGVACTRGGREAGKREGVSNGFNMGWSHAHERMARALGVESDALNVAILELEISAPASDPEVTIGNLLRSKSARESEAKAEAIKR